MSDRIKIRITKQDHLGPAHTQIEDADTGEEITWVISYTIKADVAESEVLATLRRYEEPATVELKTFEQEVEVVSLDTDAIVTPDGDG